ADRYVRDLPTTNVDSGYGSAAAELGPVGLLLFVYLAMTVGVEGLRAWRRLRTGHPKDLLLGPALIAGTYPIVSVIAQPQATLPVPNRPALLRLAALWAASTVAVRRQDFDILHVQGADSPVGDIVTAHCCNRAMRDAAADAPTLFRKVNYAAGVAAERYCLRK